MPSTVTRPSDTETTPTPEEFAESVVDSALVFAFQAGYAAGRADTLAIMTGLSAPVPG